MVLPPPLGDDAVGFIYLLFEECLDPQPINHRSFSRRNACRTHATAGDRRVESADGVPTG